MMSTAPPFPLRREQAKRLHIYIQTYRQYALTSLLPSPGRNTTLRVLQTMQGKLIDVLDQQTDVLPLVLSQEEMMTLKATVTELLTLCAKRPESVERTATLNDLAALKLSLTRY